MEKRDLFTKIHSSQGDYDGKAHLAEMIALLGPPPKELLDQEREGRRWNWKNAIENSAGKLCDKATQYFGGPFFDSDGKLSCSVSRRTHG